MGIEIVVKAVNEASNYLGIGLANIINMFNPEMIALSGGIIDDLGDYMIPIIQKTALGYALEGATDGVKIIRTALGNDAVLLGAAALAIKE